MNKLDKLFDNYNKGRKFDYYFYLIGMWLVTNDYNDKGYIMDIMVCKGQNYQEAIKEAEEFEKKTKKIIASEYISLNVGLTVLEATKNAPYFYNLLDKEEVMPDDERIKNQFDFVRRKEKVLDDGD